MQMRDVLKKLELGNSVAEFDEALQKYFVETGPFKALATNKADVIAGDKGTGKTAIFRVLLARARSIPELKSVEVIPGFNPSGNPVFQRLTQEHILTEAQYVSLWKAYIFSLVGNGILEALGTDATASTPILDAMLRDTGLRSADDAPASIFSRLVNSIKKVFPTSAGVELTMSETGIPIVTPKIEFGKERDPATPPQVRHEDALRLLNRCLTEAEITIWVALDRLDEAFQGFPAVETPALRALLRTYLDLLEFDHIRLKLFVRRDLFRKIIKGGFVNLTHINARKVEIIWEDADLLNLLCRRLRENKEFLAQIGSEGATDEELFSRIVPPQVDVGERKSTSLNWIMNRIRDGNGIKPPRNLIYLIIKAREAQMRREEREPREYTPEGPIIEADSIKKGLERLSVDRVEDTLLAESGDSSAVIERFRGGRSEYDARTLASVLGVPIEQVATASKVLLEIGFLEAIGENFKIPALYRDGLGVTQGKAF